MAMARRYLSLPASNPLAAQAKLLAMSIALPGEVEAYRLPTVEMPRTSVASLRDVWALTTPQASPVGWPAGDMLIGLYGQPGRSLMFYSKTLASASTYNMWFGQNGLVCRVVTQVNHLLGLGDENTDWRPTVGIAVGGLGPHGPSLSIGYSPTATKQFVFLDIGDKIDVLPGIWNDGATNSTMTGSVAWDVYQWMGPDEPAKIYGGIVTTITAGSSVLGTFTSATAGYFAITFRGVIGWTSGSLLFNSGPVGVNVVTNGSLDRWHMHPLSDLDPNNQGDVNIASRARVDAASLLLTNTSALTNRQGNILAARVRSLDLLQITATSFSRMAEKYENDAALGCYTFKSFSEEAAQFNDHHNVVPAVPSATGLSYDLDYDDFYHVIRVSSVITTPNNFALTLNTTIEFQTDIPRYMKDVSDFDYAALVMARRIVNSEVTWFYENPLHMSDIYGFIRNAARGVGRLVQNVAPYAAAVGSIANPSGAGSYHALSAALQRLRF